MNNLNILKNTLGVINNADKMLLGGMPLYQVKALFDGLVLADVIDFDTQYGELLRVVLDSKRKDTAMIYIIRARGCLESLIHKQQQSILDSKVKEQKQDDLAIESTCITVTSNGKSNEVQLQLTNMSKKIGRPKSENALSGAERSKRARDKKKANKLVTVNSTLSEHASKLYNEMIESGYDLTEIIILAHNQSLLSK